MCKLLIQSLKLLITLLIPLVIIIGIVRLLATESYLTFEYNKTDFPEDPFGFEYTERLAHAAANLQFVTQNQPLADLSGQMQNGTPLYNSREIMHMQDVQYIYKIAWQVWQFALILAVLSGLALAWRKESRPVLASAIQSGGALTAGLVVLIGLTAIAAWKVWFVLFHQVFFAAGSWTFDFSDTLIRLFPEKFWYDAALTISSLSLIAGSLILWVGSRLGKVNKVAAERVENEQTGEIYPGVEL